MTVMGALSAFRELGEMSPHKRASRHLPSSGGNRLVFSVSENLQCTEIPENTAFWTDGGQFGNNPITSCLPTIRQLIMSAFASADLGRNHARLGQMRIWDGRQTIGGVSEA